MTRQTNNAESTVRLCVALQKDSMKTVFLRSSAPVGCFSEPWGAETSNDTLRVLALPGEQLWLPELHREAPTLRLLTPLRCRMRGPVCTV